MCRVKAGLVRREEVMKRKERQERCRHSEMFLRKREQELMQPITDRSQLEIIT